MLPNIELECQESLNEDSMLSEPVLPVMEGFPEVNEFDQLMHRYENYKNKVSPSFGFIKLGTNK
jgi:hypothetical protein